MSKFYDSMQNEELLAAQKQVWNDLEGMMGSYNTADWIRRCTYLENNTVPTNVFNILFRQKADVEKDKSDYVRETLKLRDELASFEKKYSSLLKDYEQSERTLKIVRYNHKEDDASLEKAETNFQEALSSKAVTSSYSNAYANHLRKSVPIIQNMVAGIDQYAQRTGDLSIYEDVGLTDANREQVTKTKSNISDAVHESLSAKEGI